MIQFRYQKRLPIFVILLTISLSACQRTQVQNKKDQLEFQYFNIPLIDLTNDSTWQVTVDKEEGQYLGHPTTVLLEDNKTIYCVYPKRATDADGIPATQDWNCCQIAPL